MRAASTAGTHVSSTAIGRTVGSAKGARVVSVRVLDCEGSGTVSDTCVSLAPQGSVPGQAPLLGELAASTRWVCT